MFRTLAVVAAILLVIMVVNYRAPEDPVKQIDPTPLAELVAADAGFTVLTPTDPGWRPTAVRWEPTQESGAEPVWYLGGVYSAEGPYAALTQSTVASPAFLAEQTGDGDPVGESMIDTALWQRYESAAGQRSLVQTSAAQTTVVTGTGSWEELQRFAAALRPVITG